MPSWTTHLVVANKVVQKLKVEKNEFIFANIMPDILEGYTIKNISKTMDYYSTHYTKYTNINGISIPIPDVERFKREYKSEFNNPIILGYFSHLLLDYFWNDFSYRNYFESFDKDEDLVKVKLKNNKTKILKWDDAVIVKQKDFRIFTKYLKNNIDIEIPIYSEKIFNYSKVIKEFEYTKEDIQNTADIIKNIKSEDILISDTYQIFSEEELKEELEKSVEFILEEINQ